MFTFEWLVQPSSSHPIVQSSNHPITVVHLRRLCRPLLRMLSFGKRV